MPAVRGSSTNCRFRRWLERRTSKKEQKGVPLGPSAQDLRPWYVAGPSSSPEPKGKNKDTGKDNEPWAERRKRERDAAFKALNDPLASITHQLAARSASAPTPAPRPRLVGETTPPA
ncbi:hypothetical protein FIBSPDRAFT_1038802 [Athelia psychrophila]|uniref:Uncharacterized protein n=1 Tax=Athelia psychrophila TaxID=1759441 RepID=A0A166SFE6_9AGAM|nr:hypothetical protein FIBSPDRAFT_1038802 [Fibularhizoctonia sp. CBS 109695]